MKEEESGDQMLLDGKKQWFISKDLFI